MKDIPRWLAESVLKPDKNSDESDLTVPDLKILEPASLDTDESVHRQIGAGLDIG